MVRGRRHTGGGVSFRDPIAEAINACSIASESQTAIRLLWDVMERLQPDLTLGGIPRICINDTWDILG